MEDANTGAEVSDWALTAFVDEVRYAAAMAQLGADALDRALAESSDLSDNVHVIVFGAAQTILSAASSIYWLFNADVNRRRTPAQNAFSAARSKRMREELGELPGVLADRGTRNSFEHLAARLDDWLVTDPGFHVANVIGESTRPAVRLNGAEPVTVRSYHLDTSRVHVLHDSIVLIEVMRAIHDVRRSAESWLRIKGRVQ